MHKESLTNKDIMKNFIILLLLAILPITVLGEIKLLNVSYDPTREFYDNYNKLFNSSWMGKTGQEVVIEQSHSGSAAQARAVIEGLPADVVTLASAYDIDQIAKLTHLIPQNWQEQFPNNSCPYTSTIIFLVRQGNPKKIYDWQDLTRQGIQVITPNPKTSGGARWNYLAAWAYAIKKYQGNEGLAISFLKTLYHNVPSLETGARGATNIFVQRNVGDVLITWENEAYLILTKFEKGQYQIIRPSISILTEPPVALVVGNTNRKKTTLVAKEYLQMLYSLPAQELIAKFFFRPSNKMIAEKYYRYFPKMNLVTIEELGGWEAVQKKHFASQALFDQIYQKGE